MAPPELTSHETPSHVPILAPGDHLDRYELLCPVARGGMAEVWVGRLLGKHGFEKLFAIKTIRPDFAADSAFQTMFLDEARIASNLVHPNIAQVIDLGEQNGVLYIVMDWVVGESFQRMLSELGARKAEMPMSITLRVLREIAAGLDYAHELADKDGSPLGIVHRDVSPQNILVTASGHAKLIDFGVAKARDRLGAETGQGIMKGKLDYMSPEQANGDTVDHRADVWALGAVLYRCLAGTTPYRSESQVTTLKRLASGDPMMPLPASVPGPVAEVVHRALQFRKEDRYGSAQAMREGIEHAIVTCRLRTSSAEVATFMKDLMAVRMETTRDAIKASIKAVTGHSHPGSLFSQLHESSPSTSTPASAPGNSLKPLASAPRAPTSAPVPTPSAPTLSAARDDHAQPAPVEALPPPPEPARSRTVVFAALGLGAIVLIVAGAFFVSSSRSPSSRARAEQPPAAILPHVEPVAAPPAAVVPTAAAIPPATPEPAPEPAVVQPLPADTAPPTDVKATAKKPVPPKVTKPTQPAAPAPAPPPIRPDLGY